MGRETGRRGEREEKAAFFREDTERGRGRKRGRVRRGREGKEKEEKRRKGGGQRQHKSGARRESPLHPPLHTPHPLPQFALAAGQRADAPEKPSCRKRKLTRAFL